MEMLQIMNEPLPIRTDAEGVVRVGKTRVPIDTVVALFNNGAAPEEIAIQFPALHLADIYSVISYYLKHSKDVNAYIRRRQNIAQQVKKENQDRFGADSVRERLLARKKSAETC